MKFGKARKTSRLRRRLAAITVTAAMLLQMGATAQTEVAEVFCDEPDWNEAGLALLDLMEEYADDAEILAMLESFMERNMGELTGEMPEVVPYVEDEPRYCESIFEASAPNATIQNTGGVPGTTSCTMFRVLVFGTGANSTVTITGFNQQALVLPTVLDFPNATPVYLDSGAWLSSAPITQIAANAFGSTVFCRRVTSVTFGGNIAHIGANAFNGMSNLREIRFKRTNPPTVGANAFSNIGRPPIYIHAPLAVLEIYRSALNNTGLNTGNSARFRGLCRDGFESDRCTCLNTGNRCRFRLGHVTGITGNNNALSPHDGLQVERYLRGETNIIFANNRYDFDSFNAAMILHRSRDVFNSPRQIDADDIMRGLVGHCSWSGNTNGDCRRTQRCAANHCFS
jgi:hypothetical protein